MMLPRWPPTGRFPVFLLGHLLLEVSAQGVDTGPVEENDPGTPEVADLASYPQLARLEPSCAKTTPKRSSRCRWRACSTVSPRLCTGRGMGAVGVASHPSPWFSLCCKDERVMLAAVGNAITTHPNARPRRPARPGIHPGES